MPQMLIRDIPEDLMSRLKARAKRNGRSLQAEVKLILQEAEGTMTFEEAREATARIRASLVGRGPFHTTDDLREDRDRGH